ncbi:DUF2479 domain-containing protein [Bacillus sp. AY3-1]|uniref:BppU family phage baseplate upper protein n=1 Tax=Bacillus sp. AY3-1 TaxID=2217817 RepID=UPI0011F0999F|nr:BppU family phage baseplate upper protein [Bacillus sp. AY3-1]KAA0742012.1 DUF2479 domain-containing protein [Bacillus sp. AY3-1]
MRNETIRIDLSSPSLAKTIYSRQNDKNGLKLTVYLREYGKPVDLTGYAVKYEAAGQSGNFVRVDAKVIDATKGIFEYIFSKEAVSTSSLWLAYFAFEKGEERFTTQDLKIVLGSDVKEGSIQIENYIAEFDKLKKQIDALQIAVDKADVVKRSGDTMVGSLKMTVPSSGSVGYGFQDTTGAETSRLISIANGNVVWQDRKNLIDILTYSPTNKMFTMQAESNLLKKTGDTMTGVLYLRNNWEHTISDGSKGVNVVVNDSLNKWSIGPKVGGNTTWANELSMDLNTGAITVADLKTKKDTDWTNLTLINGVTNQSGKTSQIKRTGNTVCLNMNVIGVKNNHIIASLPVNFRPVRDLTFSATYVLNNLDTNTGFVTIRADGSVHCEWIAEGTNPLKYWSFTLTYII